MLEALEEEDTIFMKDGAKIHMEEANKVRKRLEIKGFNVWPPSSPDLNPIEKVWQWMKHRMTHMEPFPHTISELERVVQELWDELDPSMFIKEIETMSQKCEEVKQRRGLPTKY